MPTDSLSVSGTAPTPGVDPAAICTLPPEGLNERLAWVRAEILPHAVATERGSDRIAWELSDVPGLGAKLDQLVALERDCCAGIVFEHQTSSTGGRRRLEVRGIDPDAAGFAGLGSRNASGAAKPLGTRIAKAAGFGTVLSLLVCCVAPIGAAALLGATAAAPFASLDNPMGIGGAAILAGGAAFAWQSRRRAAAPVSEGVEKACGPTC